jgi:hypothetical protein
MLTYTHNTDPLIIRANIGARGHAVLAGLGYSNEFERRSEERRRDRRERLDSFLADRAQKEAMSALLE